MQEQRVDLREVCQEAAYDTSHSVCDTWSKTTDHYFVIVACVRLSMYTAWGRLNKLAVVAKLNVLSGK